jgi:ketosteroid isomerase-like protein
MSEENVEIVRRAVEAFNERGLSSEKSLSFFDADVTFEEPPEQPAPRVARGRDSAAEMFRQFDEAWEEHRSVPEEIRGIDDQRVLMLSIEQFRGRDGIEIDQPCGTLFTFTDGKITRMQSFWERENAFEAAGLSS